jgi:4,5-dihydroxyphthalate decarboxylase
MGAQVKSAALRLSFASRPYDGLLPLLRGEVRVPGVELQTHEMLNVAMFAGFMRGEYDVSEMSLAESVYAISRGKAGFVGLPVFPSRYFRHGYWFYNVASGMDGPNSIRGKRIGFQRWVQTAGVWMRGQLSDEHGVSPTLNEWYVASVHHWDGGHAEELRPLDGSSIRLLGAGATSENAHLALLDGRVDLMGTTEIHAPKLLADHRAKRLFPDYRSAEAEYFRKSAIFPIMHLVGMRAELAARHPELPAQLCAAFGDAQAIALRRAAVLPSHALAWHAAYLDKEVALLGENPWRYGLEPNRRVLAKFIDYCLEQGIAARRIEPEDLFHPSTWKL